MNEEVWLRTNNSSHEKDNQEKHQASYAYSSKVDTSKYEEVFCIYTF
jgi:hypothetical protein